MFLQTKGKSILFPLSCDLRALRINKIVFLGKSICTRLQSDEDSGFSPGCIRTNRESGQHSSQSDVHSVTWGSYENRRFSLRVGHQSGA